MPQVWKFPILHASEETSEAFAMPPGAQIVHFAMVDNVPTIWALVNPDNLARVWRSFTVYGTGRDVPQHAKHIGTWFEGRFVFHLFEVTKPGTPR